MSLVASRADAYHERHPLQMNQQGSYCYKSVKEGKDSIKEGHIYLASP